MFGNMSDLFGGKQEVMPCDSAGRWAFFDCRKPRFSVESSVGGDATQRLTHRLTHPRHVLRRL